MKKTNDAQQAFLTAQADILEKLAKIQRHIADEYADIDSVNWGHVGSLGYIKGLLEQATEFLSIS